MATACWLIFQSTWSVDSSRCGAQLCDWHIISVDLTTSLKRLSAFTGCTCRSEFSKKLLFWCTKSCMDSCHNTLVHSTMSPTCLAADLTILWALTIWQRRRSSWQLLPTRLSWFSAHGHGMIWQMTQLLPNCYPPSISNLKLTCLPNPFSDYFLDRTSPNLSLVDLAAVCITYATLKISDWLIDGWWE